MSILSYGTPEEAGFDPDRIAALKDRAPEWCDGTRMRSGVLLAARRGKIVFHEAYGPLTDKADSPPLQKDSIFSVMSATKPVTATAIMMLVEDGLLGLNRPLKEYLPEICGEGADDVEIQHLLTHTSGFSDEGLDEKFQSRIAENWTLPGNEAAGLHKFNEREFACLWDIKSHWSPGSRMEYCNYGYKLLGEILRRVSGQSITEFAAERIFDPLGMKDTSYIRDDAKTERLVRRGEGVFAGSIAGDPMQGPEGIWREVAPWGDSSMESTARDMANFGQLSLDGGIHGDKRLLSRATVHEMSRNQIPGIKTEFLGQAPSEASWGLGWMIQSDDRWRWANATLPPKGTFYHGGIGGHLIWVDPVNEIVGVHLSVCLDIDVDKNEMHWNLDLFQNMVTAAIVG